MTAPDLPSDPGNSWLEIIARERRRSVLQLLLMLGVLGCCLFLILDRRPATQGAGERADWAALQAEVNALTAKVDSLEAQRRAWDSEGLWQAEGDSTSASSPAPEEPAQISSADPERELRELWYGAEGDGSSEDPVGKVAELPKIESADLRSVDNEELSPGIEQEPQISDDGRVAELGSEDRAPGQDSEADLPERLSESLVGEPASNMPPLPISEPFPSAEVRSALNHLLSDGGVYEYSFLEAEAGPGDNEIRDVLLAKRKVDGAPHGTVAADRLSLRMDEHRRASLVLDGARGTLSGMRVDYPQDRLTIEIPGILQPDSLRDPLPEVFDDNPLATASLEFVALGGGLTHRFNAVLQEIEKSAIRVREVEAQIGNQMKNAVIELDVPLDGNRQRRVHADLAWWELDAEAARVELCCEGGELEVNGARRPFFRGVYRHTIRNIHPRAWRSLPCVRELAETTD